MEFLSVIKKNETILFSGKWVQVEITTVSEISQFHEDKYHVFFSHLWNMRKKQTNKQA
jgi:hypothetical protein